MNSNKNKVQSSEFDEKLKESINSQSKIEHSPAQKDEVIPIIKEEVRVDVQSVEKSRVKISKEVHEDDLTIDVPTVHDEVDVQRVPKNISIDALPKVRHEGDTMIIPVVKEEVVVQKQLILVEEIRVTKKRVEEHHPQHIKLRKEEVKVDRINKDFNNQPMA
ncbi:YsnF/AvaK domain-containing protein [uncultured Pontibacter sp.]|uniref:YsnF/AvaK domain-containing protein n=1 Tax=uncultured Pontibacter sp. TaxID=453356 RepID=UPI0026078133|nr:YsnF/AvaK domain-containing protein [uncultured Pontibacter sp.]